jgi:hypothetical protein
MNNDWPATPPDFPNDLSEKQLEAIRTLTRHACGMRNRAYVFPDIEDRRTKSPDDLQAMKRKRKWVDEKCGPQPCIDRNDLDAFKSKNYDSDFQKKSGGQQKLQRIFYYLYFFIADYTKSHKGLWHLMMQAYFPNDMSISDVSIGLHDFFGIDERAIDEALPVVSGVYYLYRYGFVSAQSPEVVR